jgi:hypothetical protein
MKGINRIPPAEVATPRRAEAIFISINIHEDRRLLHPSLDSRSEETPATRPGVLD